MQQYNMIIRSLRHLAGRDAYDDLEQLTRLVLDRVDGLVQTTVLPRLVQGARGPLATVLATTRVRDRGYFAVGPVLRAVYAATMELQQGRDRV